jgi:hypothetical protein
MAKLAVWTVLVTAMFCGSGSAIAYTPAPDLDTTQEVYEECKSQDPVDGIACIRYVEGVADLMEAIGVITQRPGVNRPAFAVAGIFKAGLCYANYNGAMLRQIFIRWAEKNPTQWQQRPLIGVVKAFQEEWPCK